MHYFPALLLIIWRTSSRLDDLPGNPWQPYMVANILSSARVGTDHRPYDRPGRCRSGRLGDRPDPTKIFEKQIGRVVGGRVGGRYLVGSVVGICRFNLRFFSFLADSWTFSPYN